MTRLTTWTCDNPSCSEYTDSLDGWWEATLTPPSVDAKPFRFTWRPETACCSAECLLALVAAMTVTA